MSKAIFKVRDEDGDELELDQWGPFGLLSVGSPTARRWRILALTPERALLIAAMLTEWATPRAPR